MYKILLVSWKTKLYINGQQRGDSKQCKEYDSVYHKVGRAAKQLKANASKCCHWLGYATDILKLQIHSQIVFSSGAQQVNGDLDIAEDFNKCFVGIVSELFRAFENKQGEENEQYMPHITMQNILPSVRWLRGWCSHSLLNAIKILPGPEWYIDQFVKSYFAHHMRASDALL